MGGNVKGAGPVGGQFENHEATALKVGDNAGHLHQSADMANPANKVPVDTTGHQSAQATLDKMFGTPGIDGAGGEKLVAQANPEQAPAAPKSDVTVVGTKHVESTIGNDTKYATTASGEGSDVSAQANAQADRMTA